MLIPKGPFAPCKTKKNLNLSRAYVNRRRQKAGGDDDRLGPYSAMRGGGRVRSREGIEERSDAERKKSHP